jgi:hypothetical protein
MVNGESFSREKQLSSRQRGSGKSIEHGTLNPYIEILVSYTIRHAAFNEENGPSLITCPPWLRFSNLETAKAGDDVVVTLTELHYFDYEPKSQRW